MKSVFGLKKLSFKDTCFLFFSDKAKLNEINLADNYERFFSKKRKDKLKIIEIGIGGHNMEDRGGASLRSFAHYFKNSKIYGIDLINKELHQRSRIKTFQGSQIDTTFLTDVCKKYGPFDIILDDGSHYVDHQKKTFEIMFNFLNFGGTYIIEDVGTSYIKYFGGSQNVISENNLINFFLSKTHNVFSYYIDEKNKIKQNRFIEISSIQYFASPNNDVASILIEKHKKGQTSPDVNLFDMTMDEIKSFDPKNPIQRKTGAGLMLQKLKDDLN